MKTILVTGGNRGIGLETCRQLDELGHRVIMGSRDPEKGTIAAKSMSSRLIVVQLDITDEQSIGSAFERVKREIGHLDVLINNAGINESSSGQEKSFLRQAKASLDEHLPGIGKLAGKVVPVMKNAGIIKKSGNISDISLELVGHIMDTNLYGAWRMIRVFLPLLEKSENGRIINISSGMGELNSLEGDYAGYRMSKVGLNALTIMFAREFERRKISVNAMCPGWVKTDMGGPNAPRNISEGADTAVWLATANFIPTGKFFRDRKEIEW